MRSMGRAEVREMLNGGAIAHCFVRDGVIGRDHQIRIVRDGVVVRDYGAIDSLRRRQQNVQEIEAGFECDLKIVDFDVRPGDIIEAFVTEAAPPTEVPVFLEGESRPRREYWA